MDKKGIVFTRLRDTVSFFFGLVIAAFGLIPILFSFKVIGFTIPLLGSLSGSILTWIVAFCGLYILIDGFVEPPQHMLHWALIICGLVLAVVGLIPILYSFKVIGFTIPFLSNMLLYWIIISVEGILLMVGGLTEH